MTHQEDLAGQPFARFCEGYVRQADENTKRLIGSADFFTTPLSLSREQLDAATQMMDVYLRSPDFLNTLRLFINAVIANKRYAEEVKAARRRESTDADAAEDDSAQQAMTAESLLQQTNAMWGQFVGTAFNPRSCNLVQACATPHEVVYRLGSLRLLRFHNDVPVRVVEPVLVCFSLVNRPYVLDLQRERSVIRQLLSKGLDVFLIDWGIPTDADHALRLRDYVCDYMQRVTNFLCRHTHSPQVSLLGYCMGGTMCAIFTALFPRQVRNLILLASPIDFSGEESLVNLWTREEYFDVDGLIDAFGNCPGSFLQLCFQQTKPVQNYVQKYMNLCERREDEAFLENFFALERWANDNIPIAGETFREFVKMLYQQNQLIKGLLRLDGRRINLRAITCPLLLLTADSDHLVPPSSTLAIRNLVSSAELQEMSIDAGHIGLAVSQKAHRKLWPRAAAWIEEHSTPNN